MLASFTAPSTATAAKSVNTCSEKPIQGCIPVPIIYTSLILITSLMVFLYRLFNSPKRPGNYFLFFLIGKHRKSGRFHFHPQFKRFQIGICDDAGNLNFFVFELNKTDTVWGNTFLCFKWRGTRIILNCIACQLALIGKQD